MVKCRNCGQTGHFTFKCPNKNKVLDSDICQTEKDKRKNNSEPKKKSIKTHEIKEFNSEVIFYMSSKIKLLSNGKQLRKSAFRGRP
jgi:hypothetical protein